MAKELTINIKVIEELQRYVDKLRKMFETEYSQSDVSKLFLECNTDEVIDTIVHSMGNIKSMVNSIQYCDASNASNEEVIDLVERIGMIHSEVNLLHSKVGSIYNRGVHRRADAENDNEE